MSSDIPSEMLCFAEAENSLNLKIDNDLKNILILNKFTNARVLAAINDEDLKNIEHFMAEIAPDLIEKEEYVSYYGIYHKNPKLFHFMQGQKKMIELLSSYFRDKFKKEGENRENNSRHLVEKLGDDDGTRNFEGNLGTSTNNNKVNVEKSNHNAGILIL